MMKYGVVGAVALAVLVAAMWDGSKQKKKTDEIAKAEAKATESETVSGEVGTVPTPTIPDPGKPPTIAGVTEPVKDAVAKGEEILEKYQVHPGETLKSIASKWLGDEKLAKDLLDFNSSRIPNARQLKDNLTLVFPRSRFAKKLEGETPKSEPKSETKLASAATSHMTSPVPAGMKKEEEKPVSSGGGEKKYVVKEGDTLYGVAARELGKGGRWKEIQKLNHLTSETLKKGQTIVLPSK